MHSGSNISISNIHTVNEVPLIDSYVFVQLASYNQKVIVISYLATYVRMPLIDIYI